MTTTLSRINSSAATLTKNRTEDSVTPASGMCVTCVDGCIGMCEIGKSQLPLKKPTLLITRIST